MHPRAKLTEVTRVVKSAAGKALRSGGAMIDLQDRGLRRAWHPIKGQVGEKFDEARYLNFTCFVGTDTVRELEKNFRTDDTCLRVRCSRIADTPIQAILQDEREAQRRAFAVQLERINSDIERSGITHANVSELKMFRLNLEKELKSLRNNGFTQRVKRMKRYKKMRKMYRHKEQVIARGYDHKENPPSTISP